MAREAVHSAWSGDEIPSPPNYAMLDTLALRAFNNVNDQTFAAMSAKARLEAFALEYCRTIGDAEEAEIDAEAEALGVPVDRVNALKGLESAERARILAEVLRIFGDRELANDADTKLDKLLDDVLGTSGFEGTIPG
jgi:hypothetical protein